MPNHPSELGPFIEATLLYPGADNAQVRAFVQEAIRYRVASVCVFPFWLPLVVDMLAPHNIPVATVISHDHGLDHLHSKLGMMEVAALAGVQEVNVVLNPVYVGGQYWDRVEEEMRRLVEHLIHLTVKVVVNCAPMSSSQIRSVMLAAGNAQVDFVAFHADGQIPTRDDIQMAYYAAAGDVKVMSLGGYTHNLAALRAVGAGATRISSPVPSRLVGAP